MKEQHNKPEEKGNKGDGFGDAFGGSAPDGEGKDVTVGSGVYLEKLPVGGMSVAQVRDKYADRMDIDAKADAFIDGKKADNDVILQQGQVLRFAHKAGEKG